MELKLSDEDLLPEHKMLAPSKTRFAHFRAGAQVAIIGAGMGLYVHRGNHNAIYPPKSDAKEEPRKAAGGSKGSH